MSERVELAMELFIADNHKQPREASVEDWEWFRVAGQPHAQVEHYETMADAALALGYVKPRQVTTPADLEKVPEGSLLLSHSEYPRHAGTVWRVSSGRVVERVGREAEGVTPFGYFKDPLPAIVIHSPVVAG